jgi:hypothetical protein
MFGTKVPEIIICLDGSQSAPVAVTFYDAPSKQAVDASSTSLAARRRAAEVDTSVFPVAKVRAKNFFKICCLDSDHYLDDDELSTGSGHSGHSGHSGNSGSSGATSSGGNSGQLTIAWVVAEFERSFSVGGKNSGTICLSVDVQM